MDLQKPEPPSDDRRWKLIDSTMRKHGNRRNALIETLHTVQESFGYLEEEALDYVARSLRVPLSAVYGVATFYHFFNLKPKGEHSCVICTGTACYIKGAGDILDAIEENFGVEPGETTDDGKVSVMTARCLGACSLAPVVVFDGEVTGELDSDDVIETIRRWTEDDS
ncbi:MAG: bidirectional hydrogenase complex protein HoxE [Planctomycetota bacterium]